jgi:3'-phosphoadenosine 5'-phosphosulfate sulfotransferase (PAPS reductase)/FAD synthetase
MSSIANAMEVIKRVYDIYDKVVVGFSGGKDSVTLLDLVSKVRDEKLVVVHSHDENANPLTVEFVNKVRQSGIYEFHTYIVPQVVPHRNDTICYWDPSICIWAIDKVECDVEVHEVSDVVHKFKVIYDDICTPGESLCVLIGAKYSDNQVYYQGLDINPERELQIPNVTRICPLHDWSDDDVWNYIREYQLPVSLTYLSSDRSQVSNDVVLHMRSVRCQQG